MSRTYQDDPAYPPPTASSGQLVSGLEGGRPGSQRDGVDPILALFSSWDEQTKIRDIPVRLAVHKVRKQPVLETEKQKTTAP